MPAKKRPRPRRGPRLFLNPYEEQAFTRCPRCGRAPTKVRKVYLLVFVKPALNMVLNKVCRLCESCNLLIVKQAELESLMAYTAEQHDPSVIGNDYLLVGTLDRADGRLTMTGGLTGEQLMDRVHLFREELQFDPPGWYLVAPGRAGAR
ncbi:MAG TPA: hypothetical protein VFE37_17390 [Chloroflexota bacterium]|nr:hypothetical protein [Chloroflexota bacterium]